MLSLTHRQLLVQNGRMFKTKHNFDLHFDFLGFITALPYFMEMDLIIVIWYFLFSVNIIGGL